MSMLGSFLPVWSARLKILSTSAAGGCRTCGCGRPTAAWRMGVNCVMLILGPFIATNYTKFRY